MDDLRTIQEKIRIALEDSAYFFLSNDPERALGLEKILPHFHIAYIDKSPFEQYFAGLGIDTFCLSERVADPLFRSSFKLISHPEFLSYYGSRRLSGNFIQTFKISPAFEKKATALGAVIVNTSAYLNRLFEDKISQYKELEDLPISLPKTRIELIENIDFGLTVKEFGMPFVIQFARGHTGSGTSFVEDENQLNELKTKFPQRTVKVSSMVHGASYTLNGCVGSNGIYMGGLSYQITGIEALTPEKGGTVGNDWKYRVHISSEILEDIIRQTTLIGERMRSKGYRGLFGLDLIIGDGKSDGDGQGGGTGSQNKAYIIEINARQPASIPMYTKLQLKKGQIPLSMIHLCEFLKIDYNIDALSYNKIALEPIDAAQVFIRAERELVVNSDVKTGVYRLQGDNVAIDRTTGKVLEGTIFLDEDRDKALIFHQEGYTADDLDQGGFLLLTQAQGRTLHYNQEFARMQLAQSVIMNNGVLSQWVVEALVAVKSYQI